MRILIISAFFPWDGYGGGIRLLNTIKALSRNHEITLLSNIWPEQRHLIPEVERYCDEIVIFSTNQIKGDNSEQVAIYNENLAKQSRVSALKAALRPRIMRFSPVLWQKYIEFRQENTARFPQHLLCYYSEDFIQKFDDVIRRKDFDVVDLEFTEMAMYADMIPERCLKVFTTHEARTVNYFRLAVNESTWFKKFKMFVQWWKMRTFEHVFAKKFDVVVAFSPRDQQFFQRCANSHTAVPLVPTGVNLDYLQYAPVEKRDEATAVFLGCYANYPNHDAAIYFVDKIYPRVKAALPDFKVVFVGSLPTEEMKRRADGTNIIVTDYVEDFRPYLQRSTVFIVPIRLGGGIKGKIIEAMALGIPVISTPEGAEGIKVKPGEDIIVARGAGAFADSLLKLLRDKSLQQKLSANGRKLAEELYDWNRNAAELESCIWEAFKKKSLGQQKHSKEL